MNIPADYQTPAYIVTIGILFRTMGLDKIMLSVWADILKPFLSNRLNLSYKSALQKAEHLLTIEYGMIVLAYYYSSIARRLIDIAASPVPYAKESEIIEFFREKISVDMLRVKRILARTKLETSLSLDTHLVAFSQNETKLLEFYDPIVLTILRNRPFSEIRDVILQQTDKMFTDAELIFQNSEHGIQRKL